MFGCIVGVFICVFVVNECVCVCVCGCVFVSDDFMCFDVLKDLYVFVLSDVCVVDIVDVEVDDVNDV